MKLLQESNPSLAVKYGLTLISYAFENTIDLQNDLQKLASITMLCSDLQYKQVIPTFSSITSDVLREADLCHILSYWLVFIKI